MNVTTEALERHVTGRLAARLASRAQSVKEAEAAQVVSWLDLIDLCRELDDALVVTEASDPEALALHHVVLSLAIGSGTWLLRQVDLHEVDPSVCGQTRDSLSASLELARILYRSRHAEFPAAEVGAVRQRVFNAAA
jgi:hypothetical protein